MKSGVSEHKELWHGELRSASQIYGKGWEDANQHERVSMHSAARQLSDEVARMMALPATRELVEKRAPGTWPGFKRAAEHIVSDIDPASAASPHGVFPVQNGWGTSAFAAELADMWVRDAMPSIRYARLIENAPGQPLPQLFRFATYPTAGRQPGEKLAMYSRAYDIQPDDGTGIDGSIWINLSYIVVDAGLGPLNGAFMQGAAAAEANKQICQAVEAAATTGGLDIFTDRWVPNVVIVPPSQLLTLPVSDLKAAGMDVVLEPNATSVMFADRNAITGFFRKLNMDQLEPSTYGLEVAYKVWGKVAVDPTGVGKVAATP